MLKLLHFLRTSTRAAIDLASIMVGIIIIGIVGGVIAATIFAVLPWAQDKGAKQQLDAVQTAENAYAGLHDGNYTNALGSLLDADKAQVNILSTTKDCFIAFKQSESGKTFYTSSSDSTATQVPSPWPTIKPSNTPADCSWPNSAAVANPSTIVNLVPNSIPTPGAQYGYEAGEGTAVTTFPTSGGPQNDGYERLTFTKAATTDSYSVVLSPPLYSTPLKANTTYTFTEMIRPSVEVKAYPVVFFYGDPGYNFSNGPQIFEANKWTKLSYTFTTSSSGRIDGFWPQFRVSGSAANVFTVGTTLDGTEAMVTEGADPSRQFANGDTPGWKWLGTPGNSQSTGIALY